MLWRHMSDTELIKTQNWSPQTNFRQISCCLACSRVGSWHLINHLNAQRSGSQTFSWVSVRHFLPGCLQFERFHNLISHMAAVKRHIINCSELVSLTGVVFYILWLKVLTEIELWWKKPISQQTDRQTDHLSAVSSTTFFWLSIYTEIVHVYLAFSTLRMLLSSAICSFSV